MVSLQDLFKWTLNIPSKLIGDNQQTLQPTLQTTKGPVAKHTEGKGPKSAHAKLSYLSYTVSPMQNEFPNQPSLWAENITFPGVHFKHQRGQSWLEKEVGLLSPSIKFPGFPIMKRVRGVKCVCTKQWNTSRQSFTRQNL